MLHFHIIWMTKKPLSGHFIRQTYEIKYNQIHSVLSEVQI